MARTKGVVKPQETLTEQLGRCIEYKHAHVSKGVNSGKIYAVFNLNLASESRIAASDISAAKQVIDDSEEETASESNPQRRGRRTKGAKVKEAVYEGLGHGGYTMNPPTDCQYRCKFENESPWWVNNITCHGTCKVNATCPTFLALMKGQKERIKLMSTEKMSAECPYCKRGILSGDTAAGTYFCGTTYNRVSQEYTRVCEPPKKEKTSKRRRK